jgi:NAD-dependent deacetylase
MTSRASSPDLQAIKQVARWISNAKRVLFITGAGISADSGLPTYRGVGGLYNNEGTAEGIPIEVALSGEVFRRRPELTWKYILEIERACRGATPNRGHEVIAALEERQGLEVWTLTQNVDGLHHKAGSRNLIEIHGSVVTLICTKCDWREQVTDYAFIEANQDADALPPTCNECGSVIRPDIVLFNEQLPEKASFELERQLERGFDLVLSIGTTSAFPYIAWPFLDASRSGKYTVEINPGVTGVSQAALIRFPHGAAETLGALHDELTK